MLTIKAALKVKIVRFMLAVLCLICVKTSFAEETNKDSSPGGSGSVSFYVSTAGRDGGAGTEQDPFKTLNRATLAAKNAIENNKSQNVNVYLADGYHIIEKPLVFTGKDCPQDQYKVTYKAQNGACPVVFAGRFVSGWKRQADNIWKVSIEGVEDGAFWFRQLWKNGKRCQRAKLPLGEEMFVIKEVSEDFKTLTIDREIEVNDPYGQDTEAVVLQYWCMSRVPVESVQGNRIVCKAAPGTVGSYYNLPSPGKPMYLEHNRDFLQVPGTWFLSKRTGELFYKAKPGENPNESVFTIGEVDSIIKMLGTEEKPVQNIFFKDIVFSTTSYNIHENGTGAGQADVFSRSTTEPSDTLPAAVSLYFANNCEFDGCAFTNIAAAGISIGAGCSDNRIMNCMFDDIGATAIRIGDAYDPSTGRSVGINNSNTPKRNIVFNNYVNAAGAEFFGSVGVWEARCENTRIMNNTICDLPYTGLSTGWSWGPKPYTQCGVNILDNHIHHVMQTMTDGGGIYTLGNHKGGLIAGNYIHHVMTGWREGHDYHNNAMFLDQGTCNITVAGNVIHDIKGANTRPGFEDYIRHNPNKTDPYLKYITNNHIGPVPGENGFAADIARAAGVKLSKPQLTFTADGDKAMINGKTLPWAKITALTINNTDITPSVQVKPNGVFTARVPKALIQEGPNRAQLAVSTPGGLNSISVSAIANQGSFNPRPQQP